MFCEGSWPSVRTIRRQLTEKASQKIIQDSLKEWKEETALIYRNYIDSKHKLDEREIIGLLQEIEAAKQSMLEKEKGDRVSKAIHRHTNSENLIKKLYEKIASLEKIIELQDNLINKKIQIK